MSGECKIVPAAYCASQGAAMPCGIAFELDQSAREIDPELFRLAGQYLQKRVDQLIANSFIWGGSV